MLLVVTEIVCVGDLCTTADQQLIEPNFALVDPIRTTLLRIGRTIALPTTMELVQVRVIPAHGPLHQVVKVGQCDVRGHQQAPPDRRRRTQQRNFDLIDCIARTFHRGCHGQLSSLPAVPAPPTAQFLAFSDRSHPSQSRKQQCLDLQRGPFKLGDGKESLTLTS